VTLARPAIFGELGLIMTSICGLAHNRLKSGPAAPIKEFLKNGE
jgi:hypothetical protein